MPEALVSTASPPLRKAGASTLHRLKIAAFLLFGAVILLAVLALSAGIVLLAIALALTGKGLIVLAKLFKLIWIALIPAWMLIRMGGRVVALRESAPEGQALRPEDAPALFAALDDMRRRLRGPKVDQVLLVTDVNAWAYTRPLGGFWWIPWRRRYIGLGVPLLQSLSAQEMLAVLAHEYGHLSGHPSRFDAFVYRCRRHLLLMLEQTSQWQDWASRRFAGFLRWYITCFDGISFALCRDSEYAADRIAAGFAGKDTMAAALARVRVASAYVGGQAFWEPIYARIGEEAEPTARPWSQLPALVRGRHDRDASSDLLRDALDEETGTHDTHPALADRLGALGVAAEFFRSHRVEIHPVAERSAGETWFGPRLDRLLEPFDKAWQDGVRAYWSERHVEQRARAARTAELEARSRSASAGMLGRDEAWELLTLRLEEGACDDPDAALLDFIAQHPGHARSRLAWGRANLDEDEPAAAAALREAMLLDAACAGDAALALAHHYGSKDDAESRATAGRYALMAQRFAAEGGA